MYLKWIKLAQCCTAIFVLLLSSAAIFLFFQKNEALSTPELKYLKRQLPKSSFEFASTEYINLKPSAFFLSYSSPHIHIPDLRGGLIYYGQNGRPDFSLDSPKMFFGFQGGKSIVPVNTNEKIYLYYDKTLTTPLKYNFSPNNAPTMFWFTAILEGKEAKLNVEMQDVDGFAISSDDINSHFTLTEKEFTRPSSLGAWDVGKWRVDGSLLVRQKARWIGIDKFLENHGGTEFPDFSEKHRIDFGEGEDSYFVYVKKGDCLVWDQERWFPCNGSIKTHDKPLLVVKKIDEKVMGLDIWDVEGKGKVALTLIKSPESFRHEQITRDFRFVGARTKTQVVFQIEDERLIVKPNDWLLLTKEGWRKLDTPTAIDDYVARKLVGTLFIFQEIGKKDDKAVLIGSIYNPNRTELHEIEVAMLPAGGSHQPSMPPSNPGHNPDSPQIPATPIAIH